MTGDIVSQSYDLFSEKHKILKLRLAPLRGVQLDLERKLGSGAFEDQGQSSHGRVRSQSASAVATVGLADSSLVDGDLHPRRVPREFYIRSNNTWKDRLKTGGRPSGRPSSGGSIHNGPGGSQGDWGRSSADLDDITGIIAGCREDIKALWEDEVVQRVLGKKKYRVDESSGLCVFRLRFCFTDKG